MFEDEFENARYLVGLAIFMLVMGVVFLGWGDVPLGLAALGVAALGVLLVVLEIRRVRRRRRTGVRS